MQLFKKKTVATGGVVINSDGTRSKTMDSALVLDSILIILSAVEINSKHQLQYELLRCGIFITYPELTETLKFLEKEGLIESKNTFSGN